MKNESQKINEKRLKSLFRDLVDIYSPFGKEEQVVDYLHKYLTDAGFRVERQHVQGNRYNLIVAPKKQEQGGVVFLGHVDTVDAYDFEDYGWREKGDRIFGLGTADMKGGCAAMIEAVTIAAENSGQQPAAALALVVGEEEEGDGTARLLEEYYFPWAVIAEPTGLRPCLGHFGYMEVLLRTSGKRRHASLASKKENAVEVLLEGLIEIGRTVGEKRPEVVYNIRDLFSARAGFAVADRCEAWLDIHMPPASPAGEIAVELEEAFLGLSEKTSDIRRTFRIATNDAGYELPARGSLVEALQEVFARMSVAWKSDVFRSHSDANQMWAAGVKPILLGPGRLEMAHSPEESVSFSGVCRAATIYADLLGVLSRNPAPL